MVLPRRARCEHRFARPAETNQMDLQLTGKRALVTGSTAGIGEGIARRLAAEGVAVAVHGRDRERGERVVGGIRAAGGQAILALGDLTDDAAAARVADEVEAQWGGVDILVNNSGGKTGEGQTSWWDLTIDDWTQTYQMCVLSAVRLIKRLVPGMIERKWGRVIQISSSSASMPTPGIPHYQAAKAAMTNMTVGLAKTLAATGVTANAVSPGMVLTEGVKTWVTVLAEQSGWPSDLETIEKRATSEFVPVPAGRFGRVEEIAAIVALLASPLGAFITGANIRADGGFVPTVN
jgi:3-oxoacyl-[acyl-carrier protein] reductase